MRNCKTCAHCHEVEKVKLQLLPLCGAECTSLDGYVCTARIDVDDKVEYRVGFDDSKYCCSKWVLKE